MNCPSCNQPMRTVTRSAFEEIGGKKWAYEYEEMVCDDHPQDAWQTGEQLDANVAAVKAVREAAKRLQRQPNKKAPLV